MEKKILTLSDIASRAWKDLENCLFLRRFAEAYSIADTQNKEIISYSWKCLIRKYKLREKYE